MASALLAFLYRLWCFPSLDRFSDGGVSAEISANTIRTPTPVAQAVANSRQSPTAQPKAQVMSPAPRTITVPVATRIIMEAIYHSGYLGNGPRVQHSSRLAGYAPAERMARVSQS